MLNSIHNSTNEQLFEKYLCNQMSHQNFIYESEPSNAAIKLTRGTKEDAVKSITISNCKVVNDKFDGIYNWASVWRNA